MLIAMAAGAPHAAGQNNVKDNGPPPKLTPQPPAPPPGPDEAYEGRPVSLVRLERPVTGEPGVTEPLSPEIAQLVRNNIRTREGTEFHADIVIDDAKTLNRLERFARITHRVQAMSDGSVVVTFELVERPIIQDIQAVGNHKLSDSEIRDIAGKLVLTAVNDQVIDSVARDIEAAYRKKGYYRVQVTVDQDELEETGILYFRIREGERLRVTDIRFTSLAGDLVFRPGELKDEIQTHVYWPLFNKGLLDEDKLDEDVATLATFYRDHGYLDVRVDRTVTEAPNGKEAIIDFLITAGRCYVMRNVVAYYPERARFLPSLEEAQAAAGPGEHVLVDSQGRFAVYTMGLYTSEQLAGIIQIKSGDVYSAEALVRSEQTIRDAYGKQGYVNALSPSGRGIVQRREKLDETQPLVDLIFEIVEGPKERTGMTPVHGNPITRDRVVRRNIKVLPDHPLDSTAVKASESALTGSRLFAMGPPADAGRGPKLTLQDESPNGPGYRDVLTEVQDTNTGSFYLNGQIASDGGLTVGVGMTQRNFDIAKPPDSWSELFSGRAFRGGGQTLTLDASPGTTFQNYSISFTEPSISDSTYSMSAKLFYSVADYPDTYNEESYGARLGFGRAFGSRWAGGVNLLYEYVGLSGLQPDSPVDYYDVANLSLLTGIELALSRTSVPTYPVSERYVPTRGNKIDLGIEQVGVLGGDFNFTKLRAGYTVYLPIYETFYGKTTVLSLSSRINYIPQPASEVPTYERYYQGGEKFRGFALQAISPKGIQANTGTVGTTSVGGTWSFFAGTELRQPVPFAPDILSVVAFVDSGTVVDQPGFDEYRLSIGTGLRVTIPMLSPVPLAFDLGFPILYQSSDQQRLFSFSIDVPFR